MRPPAPGMLFGAIEPDISLDRGNRRMDRMRAWAERRLRRVFEPGSDAEAATAGRSRAAVAERTRREGSI